MKRTLLAAAVLCGLAVPASALAANDVLSVTLTTAVTGTCTSGCTKSLNGPAGVNILPLIISTYQQPCNVALNGTCTAVQVVNYFVTLIGKNLTADIQAAQTATATATATAGIAAVPVQ